MTAYFYTYNAIFDAPVSGSAKLAYAYLCKCANRDGKCYPSHKAIAAAAGVCVTTVKKALAELEKARLIAVRGQARPDCGRRTNIYTLVRDAVKGFFATYAGVFIGTLTAKARLVYLYLSRLASGRGAAFPAHRTTARACGLSVSGARSAIDELETAGLVSRCAQYRDNGGQRSNLYTLTEPEDTYDEPEPPAEADEPDNADADETPETTASERETEVSAMPAVTPCRLRGAAARIAAAAKAALFAARVFYSRLRAAPVGAGEYPPLPHGGYGTLWTKDILP
jgi:predicted ArsR family transcriptional regulator